MNDDPQIPAWSVVLICLVAVPVGWAVIYGCLGQFGSGRPIKFTEENEGNEVQGGDAAPPYRE